MNHLHTALLTGLLIVLFSIVTNYKQAKYKATSCGNKAIIIDQNSGEVWITDSYEKKDESVFYLKPVGYVNFQNENYTYTPNEKRNSKNTTWSIWIKRKLSIV